MKCGTCMYILAGMAMGAAAASAVEAMGARKRRKLKRFCVASGRMLAEKTGELFG